MVIDISDLYVRWVFVANMLNISIALFLTNTSRYLDYCSDMNFFLVFRYKLR